MKIPKGSFEDKTIKPAWVLEDGAARKPFIRCACGWLFTLRLHHVHADGRVTASFLHPPDDSLSCGFHEFLELDGWDGGEFLPETAR